MKGIGTQKNWREEPEGYDWLNVFEKVLWKEFYFLLSVWAMTFSRDVCFVATSATVMFLLFSWTLPCVPKNCRRVLRFFLKTPFSWRHPRSEHTHSWRLPKEKASPPDVSPFERSLPTSAHWGVNFLTSPRAPIPCARTPSLHHCLDHPLTPVWPLCPTCDVTITSPFLELLLAAILNKLKRCADWFNLKPKLLLPSNLNAYFLRFINVL